MNINNGKTGNVNIPGPLHSTGGDGDGQIGGVVAYAGDVYDEILGKNQKEINQTLLNGSANSNVIAVALNDLNEKVEEQEKVTSSGLNDLNDKVDNLNEKVDDNEKVTATALTDLDEKTDINEKSTSVALNDLNDKIDNLNDKINDRDIVGLKSNIVVDLSTRYSTSYANLSTALTTLNNDTATDAAAIKKGGVSVKFINSSTNKYEQWNLKASSWSTNTSDWALDVDGVVPSSADSSQHDFSIEDENGNVILSIDGDRLKAGSFDSDTIPSSADSSQHDFSIEDENGNAILWVDGGYVKTKRFDSSNIEGGSYLPYARRTYFQYPVDCSYIFTSAEEVGINTTISQQVYLDNAILYLPANYDPKGKPVKLVIYCKHGASMLEPNSDPIADNFDGNIMRYLLSLGYAVLGADGIPNQFASAIGLCERVVGNYIAVQSAIRAFQTVCKNYNVDGKRVFLYGYSQGGMYAQNLLDLSKINFACAALISPVCSMRYHQWDLAASGTINGVSYTRLARLNIARLFDYPAVANNTELLALEYDQSKLQGYDPWTRNAEDVYTGFTQTSPYANNLWALPQDVDIDSITMRKHLATPIKVWCAKNDNMLGADVMRVLVKAVKNAGCVADIKLYASGAHQIQSNQNSIGTYSENGETKNLYPLAKEVAMWYYQFGGYSLT